MDFMKIIKSLELLLYELMVWLVFYPVTLFRSVAHPLRVMDYADHELDDDDDDRYSDSLSPPIFLAITLGLVHLVELGAQLNVVADGILADDRNLIAFRLVAFALFPLMMSLRMLRARNIPLDRKSLRPPFYAQCFVAAPFALAIDISTLISAAGEGRLAIVLAITSCIWFLTVQTVWFKRTLEIGALAAFGHALRGFVLAILLIFVLVLAIQAL